MSRGILAGLIKTGIAAKRNVQNEIVANDQIDTGEMYRTIDYDVRPGNKSVDVGSPKNYAPHQELGTRFMAANPFIRPGMLNKISEYNEIFGETISSSMTD